VVYKKFFKCLLPEGDALLHIVVCCKSLASQVVLKGSRDT